MIGVIRLIVIDAQSARDLFERAKFAAQSMARRMAVLERMRATEGVGGSSGGTQTARGSVSDPMRRVDERIVRESIWTRDIEEDTRTVDTAIAILYGEDGRAGLSRCIGSEYADLLWLRYLDIRSIQALSILFQCSRTTVYRKIETALDFIDSNGFAATIAGKNTVT